MAENFGANFRIDISDLKAGLKTANRMIRESESEFRAAAAGMDDWTQSQEGLEKRIKMLNDKAGIQREKVEALKKEYQRLIENGLDPTSREASDLRIKINNETAALNKSEAEIEKQTEALNDLGKEEKDAGDEATKASNGGFTVMKGVLADLTSQVIAKCIDALKDMSKQLVGIITDSAAAGDEIDKMSQKIGISAESYQEWDYVLERSGASIDGLQGGMKKLSTVITDAANGSESANKKLAALGLSVDDLNGKSQDEQLSIVIGKLQEMESGSERTAAASKLLGSSATDLAAVLNMTAEETAALKQEAHDYGMVMSDEAVKSSAAFEDSLTKAKGSIDGLKYSIAEQFLPDVTSAINTFSDVVAGKKGIDSVFNDIGKTVEKLLPKILKGVKKVGDGLSKVIKKGLPKLIKIITDSAPEILKTVSTLALEITKGMISSLPELVSAILLIANDLIRTITEELPNIVNAIVEVVPDLVQALTDPEMFNQLMEGSIALMMAIVDAIPVIIQALIPQIPTIIDNIITILMDNIPMMLDAAVQMYMALISAIPIMIQELIPALGQIWDSIYENLVVPASEKLGEMWNGIKDGAATAWKGIKNVFKNAGEWYSINVIKPIKDKFAGVWKKLKTGAVDAWDGIKEAFGTVGTWFRDTFTEAWQNVKDVFSTGGEVFSGITEGITEAFKDVVNTLIRGINIVVSQPFDSINDMLQTLRDFSFAGKHPFEDLPWLDTPQIPELARGGIVDGRSFIAGEDGAEAIIPLERNTEGLKKIAQLLAAEISSGKTSAGASYVFNQTNNSPKALSRYEIYRQTRNLVAMAKGV
jgi:hypothetical protein